MAVNKGGAGSVTLAADNAFTGARTVERGNSDPERNNAGRPTMKSNSTVVYAGGILQLQRMRVTPRLASHRPYQRSDNLYSISGSFNNGSACSSAAIVQ